MEDTVDTEEPKAKPGRRSHQRRLAMGTEAHNALPSSVSTVSSVVQGFAFRQHQCAAAAARPMPVLDRTYNSSHISSARLSR